MKDPVLVAASIREAFRETEHPGDPFLVGSTEGCEPAEALAPFLGCSGWSEMSASILDAQYTALSFFSEGGFRYFLPAYLIADVAGQLNTADPLFHLTNGFSDRLVQLPAKHRVFEKVLGKSALVNPRRYGAMTWYDHARCRLSIFTKEESAASVAYLEYKRDADPHGPQVGDITAALELFWYDRALHAPDRPRLQQQMQEEAEYLRDLS
ncbi:MAG: hypothetical protein IT389_04335 [Nitrospira sp.]|nr:hypothetical protein [Nitrospira sp.]